LIVRSDILVWRIYEKAWTGLHKLISIDGETATVEINNRSVQFRITVLKPYLEQPTDLLDPIDLVNTTTLADVTIPDDTIVVNTTALGDPTASNLLEY
jgi:hypothetical protein